MIKTEMLIVSCFFVFMRTGGDNGLWGRMLQDVVLIGKINLVAML